MIDDLSESFRRALRDRFLSPFSVSLVLSWIVVNYQFFVGLTSDFDAISKLEFLQNYISITSNKKLIWIPLFSATFYSFIYPLINLVVYGAQRKFGVLQKRIKIHYDGETPLKNSEYADTLIELESNIIQLKGIRDKLTKEKADIEKSLTTAERNLVSVTAENESNKSEIKEKFAATTKLVSDDYQNKYNESMNQIKLSIFTHICYTIAHHIYDNSVETPFFGLSKDEKGQEYYEIPMLFGVLSSNLKKEPEHKIIYFKDYSADIILGDDSSYAKTMRRIKKQIFNKS